MQIIHLTGTDPHVNLAMEEQLLLHSQREYFVLWQNRPSIIVGKNQNTHAQINADYVRENNIPVVRRLTGGGAVFHDLGNLNYTCICNDDGSHFSDYAYFCQPVLQLLQRLGVDASLHGRNDLVIDGRKFSGNAQCVHKGRVMHHGTLLFSASMNALTQALRVDPLKIQSKGIDSIRSRVTNIAQHLPEPMELPQFLSLLLQQAENSYPDAQRAVLTDEQTAAIAQLAREKYATDAWNYGFSKPFTFQKQTRLPCGLLDIHLQIKDAAIADIRIFGDYFGSLDICTLEQALLGTPYTPAALKTALAALPVERYISGASGADLLEALL